MKRLMFSAILLLALFGAVHQAKATCTPDFTATTVSMIVNKCPVEVDICYKCSVLGLTETWIKIDDFHVPADCNFDPPLTTSELLARISMEFFASGGAYLVQLCGGQGLPPCQPGNQGIIVHQTVPRCMYMQNINGIMWYFICPNAQTCTRTYKVCWDPILGLMKLWLPPDTLGSGDTDCLSVVEPDRPTPGNQTECYFVNTPCSP